MELDVRVITDLHIKGFNQTTAVESTVSTTVPHGTCNDKDDNSDDDYDDDNDDDD